MLTYNEAKIEIEHLEDYKSPDYYRTEQGQSVPLLPIDHPSQIFLDMVHHTDDGMARLEWAMQQGLVVRKEIPETEQFYFDMAVPEDPNKAADRLYVRVMAMIIAFPERYMEVFGGPIPYDYSDPRLEDFIAMSYMEQHVCNSYDVHVAKSEPKKGPGRPKKEKKEKKEVTTNSSHQKWREACRDYQTRLTDAWNSYLQLCKERKAKRAEAVEWREAEVARIDGLYRARLRELDDMVERALDVHAELKAVPKPRKDDF